MNQPVAEKAQQHEQLNWFLIWIWMWSLQSKASGASPKFNAESLRILQGDVLSPRLWDSPVCLSRNSSVDKSVNWLIAAKQMKNENEKILIAVKQSITFYTVEHKFIYIDTHCNAAILYLKGIIVGFLTSLG